MKSRLFVGRFLPLFLPVFMIVLSGWPRWAVAGPIRSPHSADACIECHRNPSLLNNNPDGIPTIIVPEGNDPHRVLANSCVQCHPQGVPPFWMVIFPKKGQPMTAPLAAAPPPMAGPSAGNPHDTQDCGECHKKKVSFDRVTGDEKELVNNTGDISDFCQRCHEEIVGDHFPRKNLPRGSTTCLTCHRIHHATKVPPLLRDDYYTFVREIRDFNPHGGNVGCMVCHPSKPLAGETPEFIYGKDLNRLCVRCHGGVEHHVIDRPPSKGTWKLEFLHYPLQDGKLACVTCHNQHGGEIGAENGGTYSLRGEPYQKLTDFCLKCHEEKSWGKLNPHAHLTPSGEIKALDCLFCHAKVPALTGIPSVTPADFNDSFTAICTQCHDPFPHPDGNHLVLPGAANRSSMKSYSDKRSVILPLDFDGRITCVTCHNPHAKGLLTGPESVGADEEKRLRLASFNEICTPCHGRH